MRGPILLAAGFLALAAPVFAGPLLAVAPIEPTAPAVVRIAAAKRPKAFVRCMRKRYGPHYFRGVKRAHRFVMAQSCGG